MRWLIVVFILAMAVMAGIGWRQASLIKEENRRLAAENEALKEQLAAQSDEQGQKRDAESKRAAADAQELAKLRGEVSRLRVAANEAEKLRSEVSALKTRMAEAGKQTLNAANQPPVASDQFPRDTWTFSGYGTPEAALVSAIWAMKEGKPQAYFDGLSVEEQERMVQLWQGKSEEEIAAKHQGDVGNIQGVRILSRTAVSPTEIQMQVFLEGVNRMETFKMKQAVDQQWKFSGFIRK